MSTNHTPNYSLSQWERTDQVLMDDFNADNAKIDAALAGKAETAAVSSLSATVDSLSWSVARRGNCDIRTTAYTGDGSTDRTHSFPSTPVLVLILGLQSAAFITTSTNVSFAPDSSKGTVAHNLRVTWTGSRLNVNGNDADAVLNRSGYQYQIIAFYSMA